MCEDCNMWYDKLMRMTEQRNAALRLRKEAQDASREILCEIGMLREENRAKSAEVVRLNKQLLMLQEEQKLNYPMG